jgi:predicted dehydrogenase
MASNKKIDHRINRREFIKRSAATGAVASVALRTTAPATTLEGAPPQDSPNSRINIAFIGTGARAHQHLDELREMPGIEVVALTDAYRGRLERAIERTGGRAKAYRDYREILARPEVDAVFVVTPDHLHKTHVLAALAAGKDVYCEKPMTYRVEEGLEIISAVKKSGRILQVGSQGISGPIQQKAREVIASGALGQVTMVRANYARNTAGGAWIYPIPPDASPATVNWEMFLGPAPKRPYSNERFFRWRCYEDYSGGIATDLFVHLMTTIHFIMNAQMPETVLAAGSLYRWRESRDVPDTLNAILQYPEGFTVNLSSTFNNEFESEGGFQILGTKGTLQLGDSLTFTPDTSSEDNSWIVESWPRALEEAYYKDPRVQQTEMPRRQPARVVAGVQRWSSSGRRDTYIHLANFFDSVRTRRQPVEDAVVGHRAASVAHLINLSAKSRQTVHWDRARDNIKA